MKSKHDTETDFGKKHNQKTYKKTVDICKKHFQKHTQSKHDINYFT